MSRTLNIGLSAEQRAARRNGLGGSDANILMSGNEDAILNLWQIKTGEREDEDLSAVLPVMMGCATEELNRYWFEKQTGRVITCEGESRKHPTYSFMGCTLDGITATEAMQAAVFEAKHVNAFAKIEEVEQKYMPQLAHNMAVCGVSRAILSVFIGTLTWAHIEVALDDWYLAEMIDRELAFWESVERREPPPFLKAVSAPVPQSKWRTVDMSGSNAWASNAVDWLENRVAAKKLEMAAKELKGLVEADVGCASGHGIEIRRSKAGALLVKEAK